MIKVRTLTDQLTTNQQATEAKLCEFEKIRDEHENELCKENQQLKDQLTKKRAEMTGKLKQTDARLNKIKKLKEQQDSKFRRKKEKLQVKLEARARGADTRQNLMDSGKICARKKYSNYSIHRVYRHTHIHTHTHTHTLIHTSRQYTKTQLEINYQLHTLTQQFLNSVMLQWRLGALF